MIFFFLKRSHRSALLSVVQQLTSHITDDDCDDEADDDTGAGGEAVFDMECQNISTHIAGIRQSIESDVSVNREDETASSRSSPVSFRRRTIHDVKSTASLQALRTYNGCDEDDEPEDPLPSTAGHVDDEIIVAGGFSSPVIKYVHYTLQYKKA